MNRSAKQLCKNRVWDRAVTERILASAPTVNAKTPSSTKLGLQAQTDLSEAPVSFPVLLASGTLCRNLSPANGHVVAECYRHRGHHHHWRKNQTSSPHALFGLQSCHQTGFRIAHGPGPRSLENTRSRDPLPPGLHHGGRVASLGHIAGHDLHAGLFHCRVSKL